MAIETLTNRQLNRATLTRQMLLERSDMAIVAAIEHLIGLQGQVSEGPYQALWSRLTGFRHGALTDLIVERTLVRATSFRATLHLHTVADLVGIRPLVQPTLDQTPAAEADDWAIVTPPGLLAGAGVRAARQRPGSRAAHMLPPSEPQLVQPLS